MPVPAAIENVGFLPIDSGNGITPAAFAVGGLSRIFGYSWRFAGDVAWK
jgi:hypothetical protein